MGRNWVFSKHLFLIMLNWVSLSDLLGTQLYLGMKTRNLLSSQIGDILNRIVTWLGIVTSPPLIAYFLDLSALSKLLDLKFISSIISCLCCKYFQNHTDISTILMFHLQASVLIHKLLQFEQFFGYNHLPCTYRNYKWISF